MDFAHVTVAYQERYPIFGFTPPGFQTFASGISLHLSGCTSKASLTKDTRMPNGLVVFFCFVCVGGKKCSGCLWWYEKPSLKFVHEELSIFYSSTTDFKSSLLPVIQTWLSLQTSETEKESRNTITISPSKILAEIMGNLSIKLYI